MIVFQNGIPLDPNISKVMQDADTISDYLVYRQLFDLAENLVMEYVEQRTDSLCKLLNCSWKILLFLLPLNYKTNACIDED